ncbi:MAG: NUDIX hydrolase [Patescibacteria group bacterium]
MLSRDLVVFSGKTAGLEKFFKLEHWRVNVDGREDDRIVWRRGGFVIVVAVTTDKKIVSIQEYKQASEQILTCLPAGAIKKGEIPLDTALRELYEETGYKGEVFRIIGPFFNSPDKSTEIHWIAIVHNAVQAGPAKPESQETILSAELLSFEEALAKIKIVLHRLALHEARSLLSSP